MFEYFIFIFILLLSYMGYAITNGRADAIKDYRTHIGKHPYRDYWHILMLITKISFIIIGIFNVLEFNILPFNVLLNIVFIVFLNISFMVLSVVVWDYNYNDPEHKWYEKDETLKISTGIKWLDKLIGLHW